MFCEDPLITYLKEFGYNAVRLPKADLRPLQLLERSGRSLTPLGALDDVFLSPHDPPVIRSNTRSTTISGKRSNAVKIGFGLNLLGNFVAAMGGSALALRPRYEGATRMTFEFRDVLADAIRITELDEYLGTADVNHAARYVNQVLESNDIFIVTATLKTKKLIISADRNQAATIPVNLQQFQTELGSVTVSATASATDQLTYEGKTPLVFAFQAVRLMYDGEYKGFDRDRLPGRFVLHGTMIAGSGELPDDVPNIDARDRAELLTDGAFVSVLDR